MLTACWQRAVVCAPTPFREERVEQKEEELLKKEKIVELKGYYVQGSADVCTFLLHKYDHTFTVFTMSLEV